MVVLTGTLLTYLMQDCGLSLSQAGLLASIQSAGNLVAGLLSGLVIKAIGKKLSSVLYCLMFAVGFSVFLYSSSPYLIYVCIFISGLGWGLCNNVCHLLINEEGMPSGGIYLMHSSYALGAFGGPMVLNLLLLMNFGWQSTVFIVVFMSLLLLISFFTIKNLDDDRKKQREPGKKAPIDFSFLKNKRYYICFFLYFCYGGVETCLNSWLITFLSEKGIMSLSTAQIMLSVLWLVIIFGRIIQIFLQKRIPARFLLLGQSGMMFVCITLLTFNKNELFAIILVIIIGLFMAGITPANALNAKTFMRGDGVSSGIIFAGSGLGSTLIPSIVGMLFDHVSLTMGMLSVCALLLLFTIMASANVLMLKVSAKFNGLI